MSVNWGPQFIVPTEVIKIYSGRMLLRETYKRELLRKELEALGVSGNPVEAVNPWFYRKKGEETWIKIGESSDETNDFAVPWNTINLENGEYEILGFMSVRVKTGNDEIVVSRQNIVNVAVEN
ncbi:MAG TPA: hypothetical protein VLR29_06765 [Flavobacterium sp.]|nr:hypothetical protein [Flavobacterium sp.]